MHIDPLFHSDAPIAAKCHYHLNEKRAKSSRVYGQADSGCDSPPLLIQHTFAALRDSFSGIAVINRTASLQHYRLLGQQPPLAFVLWTGDNSRHDRDENLRKQRIEVYEHNVFVVQHFLDAFDTTTIPVIPTIGNWDVFPVSQLACRPPLVDPGAPNMAEFSALSLDDPPVYDPALVSLWSLWEPLFPNPNDPEGLEAKRTFLKFGFFSRSVLSGTTEVLSLNTLSFFNENALVLDCAQFKLLAGQKREWDLEHPGDAQLAWMEDRFLAARIDSRKIILQGHVGPNGNNEQLWKDNCFEWGVYFSGEYSDVIIGQYYGHINRDLVHVISVNSSYLLCPFDKNTQQRHPRNKPNAYKVGRNSTLMSTIAPIVVNPFRLTTMVPNIIKSFDVKSWGVVSAIHTSSSIVPAYNPGFRVGIIEITPHESPQGRSRPHNRENLHANFLHVEITEHETRFLDISAANKAATEAMDSQQPLPPLVYKSSCNSRLDHEMEDLSPSSFQKWIATMQGAFPDLNKKTGDGAKLLRRYTKCIETSYGVMSNEFGDPIKIVDIRGAFGSFVTLLVFLYLSIWIRKRKKQVWTVMEVGVEGSDGFFDNSGQNKNVL
ncbi:hypothetical protein BC830DRAFT_837466 [Chytriomyces sp. MP71]|nr:hypothetical protein BC830DRAFT_837466 [Chytriomyces sp. MP71]